MPCGFGCCFGFFLGLAVLAKGPAAILLAGSSVLLWAIVTGHWRDAIRCLHPLAFCAFCVTALPWYLLCARRNPDFFRVFIIEHNFKRYLTPEFQHMQPFWYYGPILLIAFVPWTALLLWAGYAGAAHRKAASRRHATAIFLLCWALFPIAFFSISRSKLPGYILPAIPALALLLCAALVRFQEERRVALRVTGLFAVTVCGVAAIVVAFFPGSLHNPSIPPSAPAAAALILLSFGFANLLPVFLATHREQLRKLAPLCVVPILGLLLGAKFLAPQLMQRDPSAKTLAGELQNSGVPLDQVWLGPLPRGQEFGLNFYVHRQMRLWDAAHAQGGYLLLRSQDCGRYVAAPLVCATEPIALSRSCFFLYRIQ